MTATTPSPKPQPSTPVDINALANRLAKLIDSYRGALKFVEQLAPIGQQYYRRSKYTFEVRWVAKPLVRFFVASHIKRKIDAVLRALRIEAMMIAADSDKRKKEMSSIIKQLEEVKLNVFSKRRRLILILQSSSLPLLLTLLVTVSAQIIGIKLSNASDVIKLLKEITDLTDLSKILGVLKLLGAYAILSIPFLIYFIVQNGFKIKRAIFQGGETISNPLEARIVKEIWDDFPDTNIYQAENEFFDLIQIRKPKEFPLDFVLRGYPYIILVFTVTSILYWVRVIQGMASVNIQAIILSAALSFAIVRLSKTIYKNYMDRLDAGNI